MAKRKFIVHLYKETPSSHNNIGEIKARQREFNERVIQDWFMYYSLGIIALI